MKKTRQKNTVRSTRSWSWSGEGALLSQGIVKAGQEGICQVILVSGTRIRRPRAVHVLVKVTEVRR